MDLYLKEKTAIVTGASQGIGRAISLELAQEGVRVFAVARNAELLHGLQQEIQDKGGVAPVTFVQDLLEENAPARIAAAAISSLGQIDILINNAGRSRPVALTGAEADWKSSMKLDFERPRQLIQVLLPHFISRKRGVILNLTSTYELRSLNVSAIAKGALTALSKQLAGELGKFGIRVNCLQPGLIDTGNIRPYFDAEQRAAFAEAEIPLGDFGRVQDMANAAVFLVSERASYITGSVIAVDGGLNRFAF